VGDWEASGRPPTKRPLEEEFVAVAASGSPVPRYSSDLPTRAMRGDVEAMALYAGQGVGVLHDVAQAARIAQTLADEATDVLARVARKDDSQH
jgi:hypothetical protein